jgi:hypothetical protein
MKALVPLALGLAATAALAQAPSPAASERGVASGYQARLVERYCEKLREGPEAYTAFVRRMALVTGYTYGDFADLGTGTPPKADCRTTADHLAQAKRPR